VEQHHLKYKGDNGERLAMSNRVVESFIRNLTGASGAEIQEYVAEVRGNHDFHNAIEENQRVFVRRRYPSWDFSIGTTLGVVLYAICRRQKPDVVVETGVASGMSSSYILCALEQNKHGQLYSIDLPSWRENQSGWMIPDYLRRRWHLILGKSSETLVPLLKKVGEINIFLHDSEHSYQNMLWEFQTAWMYLKVGGLLLSHNIDVNDAFSDFCQDYGVKGYTLTNMGGMVKAETIKNSSVVLGESRST
jgi:predicted O-methyltransferase YrrM